MRTTPEIKSWRVQIPGKRRAVNASDKETSTQPPRSERDVRKTCLERVRRETNLGLPETETTPKPV